MLTKKEIAFIRSLSKSTIRKQERLFTAEGYKSVMDLLPYFNCRYMVISRHLYNTLCCESSQYFNNIDTKNIKIVDDNFDFSKISNMKSSQGILAVLEFKNPQQVALKKRNTYIFLEDIQDPGNMGTIIRTADWFAIDTIFVTKGCVDVYNNKVVQSTMGSLARVNIVEIEDTVSFFKSVKATIFGTFIDNSMDINDITRINDNPIILVMGNEGNGISQTLSRFVDKRITIPLSSNRTHKTTPDSLNVSVATAIALFKLSTI